MIRTIVFDFDGTLADSKNVIINILRDLAPKYGYQNITSKEIKYLEETGATGLIKNLKFPAYKLPFLIKEIPTKIEENIINIKPFKEIPSTLQGLKQREYRLGILTTNSKKNVESFLIKNKINYFDFIYHGSSLFGKDKLFSKMVNVEKLNKNETVYVGDEDRDIVAAKKVGVKIVSVTWGFNSKELLEDNKPDLLIDKPSQLLDIFT